MTLVMLYSVPGGKSIILACTHYPLIIKEIGSYYKGHVNIINSAEIVSLSVEQFLKDRNLLNKGNKKPKHEFYAKDLNYPILQPTKNSIIKTKMLLKLN